LAYQPMFTIDFRLWRLARVALLRCWKHEFFDKRFLRNVSAHLLQTDQTINEV